MDSIEPPSFSLGFDLDAPTDPQPNPPSSSGYNEPEPPSFSLGFDLDQPNNPSSSAYNDPEPPGLIVSDSDRGLESEFSSPPVLKRLRRGINTEKCLTKDDKDDDDIEEFSSPENNPTDAPASTRSHFSSCVSSKVPLKGSGVVTNQPSIARGKRKQSDVLASTSSGSGISSVASLFQSFTRSPLRRFQLLDSDSEDDHPSTKTNVSSSSKGKESGSKQCNGDLWKDFSPVVSKIQTPALDGFCQEYFSSVKTSNTARKQGSAVASSSKSGLSGLQQTREFSDLSQPSPPSHRFFLHSDPRIRSLVRQRLPNFMPLGIVNDREGRGEASLVDYMNQFGSTVSSKVGESSSKSAKRGQAKSKVPKGKENAHASEGWLNPKATSAAPKDAGRRRVSAANSGPAGHWFTSPEGRKVYISKSGQEFAGQSAYRCYKKETGGGFKKAKTKRQPKKKAKK